MLELFNILEGKAPPSHQPPSRLSPIAIWPFVMKELVDNTSPPYGIIPPTSPEPEHWDDELIDLPPPSLPPPPPPSQPQPMLDIHAWETELIDLPPPPPSLPTLAVRPTSLPARVRHRNRRLRFSPYDVSIHVTKK